MMNRVIVTAKKFVFSFWEHKVRSLILILILGGIITFLIKSNKPPQVEKAKVRRESISVVVEASGQVQANEAEDLMFSVPGKVVWVGVKKGDTVSAYQTVASMDIREVEKSLRKKLLDYMTTRWDFEQLQDDNGVHGNKLNDVGGLTDAEKRILEKSQFGLDQAVLDVEIANLAQEEYYLMSPINGVVVDTGNLVAGERLNASTVTTRQIRIINPASVYFQANVDETDYAKVKIGQKVDISLDSYPGRIFRGMVAFVGKEGVKKTGGSVQVPLDVSFDSLPENLIPELKGDVQIITETKSNALTIDKKFLHTNGNGYSVSVIENGKLVNKPVQVGISGTDRYEIIKGLNEGDTVVNQISP